MEEQEQKIRENIKTGKKNYSVVAGAGAGKTTLLSERVCHQIEQGTPLSEFAIITFTNAAANELKDKIAVRLVERREELEGLQVSTIHSFLLRILKEFPFESGVSPEVELLPEEEEKKRQSDFFDAWYRNHILQIRQHFQDDWLILHGKGEKAYKKDHTREVLQNMFFDLANVREDNVFLQPEDEPASQGESENYQIARKVSKAAEYMMDLQKDYQRETDQEVLQISEEQILFRAKSLLENHPEVKEKLRKKYTKIYVDEFQDTSWIQAEVVRLLTEGKEDALFVVGDPKQSIYRFTGAELAVYQELNQKMEHQEGSSVEHLDHNFRSEQSLVTWFNEKYKTIFQNMEPAYSDMKTDRKTDIKNVLNSVFQYNPEQKKTSDKGKWIYETSDDAEEICKLIKALVSKKECLLCEYKPSTDGKMAAEQREIRYSDFMILTWNTIKMGEYLKKLSEAGIPVQLQGKIEIGNEPVLRNFLFLLRFLGEKERDEKAVQAAIQTVFQNDIANLTEKEQEEYRNKLLEIYQDVCRKKESISGIVSRLLKHEELYFRKTGRNEEDILKIRARLYQAVENCMAEAEGDLKQFAECFETYLSKLMVRENALEYGENAVRLMNVHQSKGLTGNIVIIADRRGIRPKKPGAFKAKDWYYPVARYLNTSAAIGAREILQSFCYNDAVREGAETAEKEEFRRLEYVAATRAAHALIFMPEVTTSKGSRPKNTQFKNGYETEKLETINDWIKNREKEATSEENPVEKQERTVYQIQNLTEHLTDGELGEEKQTELGQEQRHILNPSGLEKLGKTGYLPSEPDYEEEERPDGNIFGNTLHRTCELIVNVLLKKKERGLLSGSDPLSKKELSRIIHQAVLENRADILGKEDNKEQGVTECRRYVEFLSEKMEQYLTGFFLPLVSEADEVYTELPFSFYVTEEAEIKVLKSYLKQAWTKEELEAKEQEPDMPENGVEAKEQEPDMPEKKSGKRLSWFDEDRKEAVWVNGIADLVTVKKQKDGTKSVKVYDYKSDLRSGMQEEKFEDRLKKKYDGQIRLYQYAMEKIFRVKKEEVQTELVHLYR